MFNTLRQRLIQILTPSSTPVAASLSPPTATSDASAATASSTSAATNTSTSAAATSGISTAVPSDIPVAVPSDIPAATPAVAADDSGDSIFNYCLARLEQNPSLGHLDYYGPTGEPVHLRVHELPRKLSDRIQMGVRLAAYYYVDTFQLVGDLAQSDHGTTIRFAELVSFLLDADELFAEQVRASIRPMPFIEESFTSPDSRLAALRAEIIQSLVIIGGEDAPNNLAADLKAMILRGGYPRRSELVVQFIQYLCWIDELVEAIVLCGHGTEDDISVRYYPEDDYDYDEDD